MSRYSTLGGVPTRSEAYLKLLHHLEEAQNQAAVLSHLHKTEGTAIDDTLASGWLGISELMKRMQVRVTELATGKLVQ